jgi:hypothetical protein
MGSALRRIAGKYIMTLYGTTFATHLLPLGQFGIALQGGLQLLIDSARTQLHHHMISPPTPTRALLLLDLTNMFNCVSRQALRDILQDNPQFEALLPFFDLLYADPNKCYYRDPAGDLQFFLQQEGFAQGCPLAPAMASLVLAKGIQQIAPHMTALAAAHLANHDHGNVLRDWF